MSVLVLKPQRDDWETFASAIAVYRSRTAGA